jgi:hypothetical protein
VQDDVARRSLGVVVVPDLCLAGEEVFKLARSDRLFIVGRMIGCGDDARNRAVQAAPEVRGDSILEKVMSKKSVSIRVLLIACFTFGAALTGWSYRAVAADDKMAMEKMAADKMAKEKMMKDHMMMMEEMKKDPTAVAAMHASMMRMMVMDHMSKMMADDPEFQKMHMAMDPAMKSMMMDEAMMAKTKEAIMNDPAAMKMVQERAMMMAMHHEGGMDKKMDMEKKMDVDKKMEPKK